MRHAAEFLFTGPTSKSALVEGLVPALLADGVPVDRLWVGGIAVHPLLFAIGALWSAEGGHVPLRLPFAQRREVKPPSDSSLLEDGQFRFYALADHAPGSLELPKSLWDNGYAELGVALWTVHERPLAFMTIATRSGFTSEAREVLTALSPLLGLVHRLADQTQMAEAIACTYLGADTARRVIAGEIHRGDGEHIRAAIWFSDLRGFSALSETLPTPELLAVLDDAFEAQVNCIERHGGEVLKFIGDGLLAVFRHNDEATACRNALASAQALDDEIASINVRRADEGAVPLRYGLSLHYGDVVYGNIGARARLDFTVVGPAVNLAARLEGLCGPLGRTLLVSAAFAERSPGAFLDLGRHAVKGVGEINALAPA